MAIQICKSGMNRDSVFGYSCNRCLICCRDKKIQLNPYEICRLAGNIGMSTTRFIEQYTTTGGTVLRFRDDGPCIFLDHQGCTVHADRPLVCRFYPLGRHMGFSGSESFSQVVSEEGCQGRFHKNGIVHQYLTEQGAYPFMNAADRYLELLVYLMEKLKARETVSSEYGTILETVDSVVDSEAGDHDLSWIDMDLALAQYCSQTGRALPSDPEEKMALHILAVRTWTDTLMEE